MNNQSGKTVEELLERIKSLENDLNACKDVQYTVLSNMMHEVRTPLNGIMGFSEIIDDPSLSDEERKNYSGLIIESSYILLNIINDVVDITKLQTGKYRTYFEYFDINELMAKLYAHYKSTAEKKNLQFFLENVIGQPTAVWSDKEAIERVMKKLIDNAIKFTKDGWVKIRYVEEVDDTLSIFVEDTGLGMGEDIQDKLFNRFTCQQVSQSRNLGGTGIDLSLASGIIKALKGKITMESIKGKGSSFKITLFDYK
ncbi:MAG: HAMP domain-containing histidine kinase [Prolixibacteraceae bacterium]|nr:HAMP domain-containing histidine kinase [Prolixibacteraceae bacterium]